jgi:hypothetical protein
MKARPYLHEAGREPEPNDDGFYIFVGLVILNVIVILAVVADLSFSLKG